jgi:hypothetical protein
MKKLILCCLLSFVVNQGYAQDDEYEYLGTYSTNEYDPNSTSNSYGVYGSPYSPDSINNPHSIHGSKYSPQSPNNPFATEPPNIIFRKKTMSSGFDFDD